MSRYIWTGLACDHATELVHISFLKLFALIQEEHFVT